MRGSRTVLTFRNAGRRERIDRARSDLVATVSHEIRSPLTSVKGFTRTMLTKWERFSDEQKRTMLETINLDADRVTRLLKELLDVSRIDAGRVELHREMIDVGPLAKNVVEKAQHRPDGTGRSITVSVATDLPAVYADPDKIEQVLTNLVENALKYAPDSPVEVGAEEDGDDVHLWVSDRGPGISPDQLRRVFEKFGRGRENRRSGTGLGLYITRGLVTAHGGRIWADSTEGEGSTFHVVLPAGVPEELVT
ncbi:MAG: HAMP domain-containing sensor histidine kinase [Nitriliruptorales bacterium]|nr:HAMP domain-containing sensor histidine kinase [Nitriliruptorales bacterium]